MAEQHNAVKDAVIKIEEQPRPPGLPRRPTRSTASLKSQEVRFLAPKPLFRAFPT
jgi:hypothetical protein